MWKNPQHKIDHFNNFKLNMLRHKVLSHLVQASQSETPSDGTSRPTPHPAALATSALLPVWEPDLARSLTEWGPPASVLLTPRHDVSRAFPCCRSRQGSLPFHGRVTPRWVDSPHLCTRRLRAAPSYPPLQLWAHVQLRALGTAHGVRVRRGGPQKRSGEAIS